MSDLKRQLTRLEQDEMRLRADRKKYQKSKTFCYGDSIHQDFNKRIDENVKAQNKITKMLYN